MMVNRNRNLKWFNLLRRCDAGSALVETALTVPVVLMMLLGAVEMGDFAYKATEMANAARAAAQYGAMNGGGFTDCNGTFAGGTCASTSGMYLAAQKDAPRTVLTCTSFAVTSSSSCICSGNNLACGSSGTYSCSSGKPIVNVTVNTSAQCLPAATVPNLFSGALTLKGFAQEEVLQ